MRRFVYDDLFDSITGSGTGPKGTKGIKKPGERAPQAGSKVFCTGFRLGPSFSGIFLAPHPGVLQKIAVFMRKAGMPEPMAPCTRRCKDERDEKQGPGEEDDREDEKKGKADHAASAEDEIENECSFLFARHDAKGFWGDLFAMRAMMGLRKAGDRI